ncbi:MAG: hypothetical protein HC840_07120 [Leptolyngbyaceae cyanobacterium RM2_2_4]|nr:hypothetical protein [Leptolyngbyaceae cyanobacterium RM2_2_4]
MPNPSASCSSRAEPSNLSLSHHHTWLKIAPIQASVNLIGAPPSFVALPPEFLSRIVPDHLQNVPDRC